MWLQTLTLPFAVPGLVRYFSTVRLYGFHCKVGSGAVDEEQLDRDCVDPVAYFVAHLYHIPCPSSVCSCRDQLKVNAAEAMKHLALENGLHAVLVVRLRTFIEYPLPNGDTIS